MKDRIKIEHNYLTGGHRETNIDALNRKSKKKEVAKKMKNQEIDKKYAKLASDKGLTPSGKRKSHFYNTVIK